MKKYFLFLLLFLSFQVLGQHSPKDSLLKVLSTQTGKEAIATLLKIGTDLLLEQPEEALKYGSVALEKARSIQFKMGEIEARNLLGNAFLQRSQAGDIREAFKVYTQNIEILENASLNPQEEQEKARTLSGLANIYYQWGEYKEATLLNLKSLKIREKIKDEYGIARCFNTSGVIYDALGEYRKAIVEYTKALNIYEKLKKKREVAGVLDNLASSLKLQIEGTEEENPDYSQIIDYYNRSLKISEEIHDTRGVSRTLNNLGILAQSQKNYARAKKFYEKSIEMALLAQEKQGLASTYNNLARLHQEQNLLDDALFFYEKALEIADETESKYELYVTLKERSKVFASKGLLADAYSDLQASNLLKQQLDETENLRNINTLTSRYEIEKFQKENERLQYEATIQSQNNQIFWGFGAFFLVIALITALFYFRQNQLNDTKNKQLQKINKLLADKNKEVLEQKEVIEEKTKQLQDSINYAQTIQQTMLPTQTFLENVFGEIFVFYQPKATLSGDFYWAAHQQDYKILVCGDCEGHSISGAMMTMMAMALLNEIVLAHQVWRPAKILSIMNEKIRKYKSDKYGNDGIDLGIILISEKNTKEILFSGAKMDLWLRQNGSLSSVKAARYAVGIQEMTATDFRDEIVKIEEESILYLFSDGITDQFGGENQKKLSTKGIEKMLAQLEGHLFEVQNEKLVKELSRWQGQNEQTDDMTLIALHLTSKNKASA